MQTPAMLWPLVDTVIYFAGYLMIESFWTPYLMRSAGATQYQAALAFFISGGSYVLSSIVAGCVSFNDVIEELATSYSSFSSSVTDTNCQMLFPLPVTYSPLLPLSSLVQ